MQTFWNTKSGGKQYTGSYELGQTMGLSHPAAYTDEIIGNKLIDVMSYGENREPPKAINTRQLIDKIDLSDKSKQIIRGTP